MSKISKADLHIHTNYSDGFSSPQKIVDTAIEKGLDFIAITDHNLIKSAQIAKNYALKNKLPIKVIIGEEITATKGEIIGLFLKKAIPPYLTPEQTAKQIKKQGGLIFIPHPHRVIIGYSLSFKTIDGLVKQNLVDGLEVYNFWDYSPQLVQKRKQKNKKWNLAPLANTDSHHYSTVGHYYTEFKGETSQDLKNAIEQRKTKVYFNHSTGYYFNRQIHHGILNIFSPKADYPGQTSALKRLKHLLKLISE